MRIKNPKRTFFIGLAVWLLFFRWWLDGFLVKNWRFPLFSFKSWRYLMNEFKGGWQITSTSDWIFVSSLLMAPFIFIFLWYVACKANWGKWGKKIWKGIRWPIFVQKRKKLNKSVAAYTPKNPLNPAASYRPLAMPSSGLRTNPVPPPSKTFLNNTTAMGRFDTSEGIPIKEFNEPESFSTMPVPPFTEPSHSHQETFTKKDFEEMANTPISDIQIPKMEPVKENISSILEKAGYTFLEANISKQDGAIFAASSQELWIILNDTQPGDWLADEESFNDEDPLWFSETDHRVSPVFQLKTWAEQLQQKLGELIQVRSLLIEKDGVIINAEDMMKTWNDLGVVVCRTAEGGPVELPTISEVFKEPQEKIEPDILEKLKSML